MTESILNFIEQESQWAMFIVFVIALLESVAILGLFVPGWLILVGVGTLIGSDVLAFYPIVIAAYLGAVIGEYLSFMFGYHYHERILAWSIMKRHEKLIAQSHEFFQKHGVSGVFIGRFFGPTRAIVPMIAGISEMPPRTFVWVNLISGLLWAPLYLIPGILVGAAYGLESESGYYLIFFMLLFAIASTASWKYWQKYWQQRDQMTDTGKAMINSILMSAITLVMVMVFIQTPYWILMQDIFLILFSKL